MTHTEAAMVTLTESEWVTFEESDTDGEVAVVTERLKLVGPSRQRITLNGTNRR